MAVKDACDLLYYKPDSDDSRAFRAYSFTHSADYALGKGPCDVYRDTDFLGRALLAGRGRNEQVILVYARESMVHIETKPGHVVRRQLKLRLADGLGMREDLQEQTTVYRISNHRDREFQMIMEPSFRWQNSHVKVSAAIGQVEEFATPQGRRLRLNLPANKVQEVTLVEHHVICRDIRLDAVMDFYNVIQQNTSLMESRAFRESVNLMSRLEEIRQERQRAENQLSELLKDQERLMKLIPCVDGPQATNWKNDLVKIENEVRQFKRKTLLELSEKLKCAEDDLKRSFRRIKCDWQANA